MTDDDVRPQLASVTRSDGTVEPLAVVATDDPTVFALRALHGGPVEIHPGDRLWVDVLGPGQGITVDTGDQEGT